jgi:hypothetical protein
MDSTVSTRAVVTGLFDQLPANGSELVVFDINQAASFRPLFKRRPGRHLGAAAGCAEALRCHDYYQCQRAQFLDGGENHASREHRAQVVPLEHAVAAGCVFPVAYCGAVPAR